MSTQEAPRCGLLIRASTQGQADNTSPETQLQIGTSNIKELGGIFVSVYQEVVSGALYETRDGVQDALRDIESGVITHIVFPNVDRYSRETEYQSRTRKRIDAAGGTMVFYDFNYDGSPNSIFLLDVLVSSRQLYRHDLARKTIEARRQRALEERQPMRHHSPDGYRIVTRHDVAMGRHTKDEEGHHVVLPEQAQWVVKMYEMCAAGESLSNICGHLQNVDVPTAGNGRQKALGWKPTTVSRILSNTAYYGSATHGQRERMMDGSRKARGHNTEYWIKLPPEKWISISSPAPVFKDLWDAAQVNLAQNRARLARRQKGQQEQYSKDAFERLTRELTDLNAEYEATVDAQIRAIRQELPTHTYEERMSRLQGQIEKRKKRLAEFRSQSTNFSLDQQASDKSNRADKSNQAETSRLQEMARLAQSVHTALENPDVPSARKNLLLREIIERIDVHGCSGSEVKKAKVVFKEGVL